MSSSAPRRKGCVSGPGLASRAAKREDRHVSYEQRCGSYRRASSTRRSSRTRGSASRRSSAARSREHAPTRDESSAGALTVPGPQARRARASRTSRTARTSKRLHRRRAHSRSGRRANALAGWPRTTATAQQSEQESTGGPDASWSSEAGVSRSSALMLASACEAAAWRSSDRHQGTRAPFNQRLRRQSSGSRRGSVTRRRTVLRTPRRRLARRPRRLPPAPPQPAAPVTCEQQASEAQGQFALAGGVGVPEKLRPGG
jgi:hypothetical protein